MPYEPYRFRATGDTVTDLNNRSAEDSIRFLTTEVRRLTESAEFVHLELTMPQEIPSWRIVGAAGQPGFQNGFSNWDASQFTATAFRMWPNGIVEIGGLAKQPAAGSTIGLVIFTLPAGYHPARNVRFTQTSQGSTGTTCSPLVVQVSSAGAVIFNECFPINSGWTNLDNIRFQATSAQAAAPDTFGAPFPVKVKSNVVPSYVSIVAASDKTAGVLGVPANIPTLNWQPIENYGFQVNSIWGLQPGRKYGLVLKASAGDV